MGQQKTTASQSEWSIHQPSTEGLLLTNPLQERGNCRQMWEGRLWTGGRGKCLHLRACKYSSPHKLSEIQNIYTNK